MEGTNSEFFPQPIRLAPEWNSRAPRISAAQLCGPVALKVHVRNNKTTASAFFWVACSEKANALVRNDRVAFGVCSGRGEK